MRLTQHLGVLATFEKVAVTIEAVREPDEEVRDALGTLLPQLNRGLGKPSRELLAAVVADPAATLLVARVDGQIVGTATVAVVATPTCITAHINDVVVDDAARRQGAGRRLMEAALEIARERGAGVVRLTTAERRGEAHRLYESLGFKNTGSRAYRLDLG